LIECSLLALMAGALGLGLSYYGVREIAVAFSPLEVGVPISMASTPYWLDLSMSASIYAFVGALCLFTTLAFGLVPALHVSRTDPHDTLKEGGRTTGGVRARRWTSALMVSELALTLMLLCQTALLWRSFVTQYRADTVLDPIGVVTMQFSLPIQKYPQTAQRQRFMQTLDERLRGIPAVKSIALSNSPPLQRGAPRQVALDGQAPAPDPNVARTTAGYVSEHYFEALGLSPLLGRLLTRADSDPGREAVLVNQRFADMFLSDGVVIGRRIQLTGGVPPSASPWLTVVGVVPTLPVFWGPPPDAPDPAVYMPLQLDPTSRIASITVRAEPGGDRAVAAALREQIRSLDPDLPLFAVAPLEDVIARARYPTRLVGTWFGVLAIIALVVASVGLFAITAHGVAQRTQEIGVRLALGAPGTQLAWMFLRRTLLQIALGGLLGLAGTFAAGTLLQTYLRDTSSRDPLTLALVVALLTLVATMATLLPARRAARIDPAVALRTD
jgi:predicted permease